MTLHEKIVQARLLAERGHPGNWHTSYSHHEHMWEVSNDNYEVIASAYKKNNADFIAQSRTLLPALAEALAIAVDAFRRIDKEYIDTLEMERIAYNALLEIGRKMGVEG